MQPQQIKLHVLSCSRSINYSQWDESGPRPVVDGLEPDDGFYILMAWGKANGELYFPSR